MLTGQRIALYILLGINAFALFMVGNLIVELGQVIAEKDLFTNNLSVHPTRFSFQEG